MRYIAATWVASAYVAVLLIAPTAARVQDPANQDQQPQAQSQPGQTQPDMSARCQTMMAQRDKVMEEVKANDEQLDTLVSKMNAASGQDRIDATAAVVSEMVAQRKAMRERMMSMQQNMMGHMAEHMQAGPQSMAACPMMKMGGMKH